MICLIVPSGSEPNLYQLVIRSVFFVIVALAVCVSSTETRPGVADTTVTNGSQNNEITLKCPTAVLNENPSSSCWMDSHGFRRW